MIENENTTQLVTFRLSTETYGIDIMEVNGIVEKREIRAIPRAPTYVAGLLNLRGMIIPIIDLRRRFNLAEIELSEEDELLSGFVIISVAGQQIGIVIDRIFRVVSIGVESIQPPPQMLSGIGAEYIQGVVNEEDGYLIILDIQRLFDPKELQQLSAYNS